MPTHEQYRTAARVLWGEAGAWAVDEYERHNACYFGGKLPPVPVVIGLTAYGKCLGLTRHCGEWSESLPRITLWSALFAAGTGAVSDVILHEMVHVRLMLTGEDPRHNGKPWCAEIVRLSPLVLGQTVQAKPVLPRRVNGVNRRIPLDGHLERMQLASWPYSLRPAGGRGGRVLKVSSY
jgi:hypothetical protein